MQVVGNRRGRLPVRPQEVSAPAFHAASGLRLSPVRQRQVGDSRRPGHLQHQHARLQLLLADRHGPGLHRSSSPTLYNPNTHAIGYQWPQIDPGAGGTGCTNCYGTDYFGTANSTNWKDPYTEQWSLSVDHDFGSGYAGRISLHRLRDASTGVGAGREHAALLDHRLGVQRPHQLPPLPQLGPHQHPRHRRQRELPLATGRGQPPAAEWP